MVNREVNQMLEDILEFLNKPIAKDIMDAYYGRLPVRDIKFLSEDEVSIVLCLRILDRLLKEKK